MPKYNLFHMDTTAIYLLYRRKAIDEGDIIRQLGLGMWLWIKKEYNL